MFKRLLCLLALLPSLSFAGAFDNACMPSIISTTGKVQGVVVGNQVSPNVTFTGTGVVAFWYCLQNGQITGWQWHVTYSYLDAVSSTGAINWPATLIPAVLSHLHYFQSKTPAQDCSKPDSITDKDEKALCNDANILLAKNWPKVTK